MTSSAPAGFLGLSHLGIVSSVGWASLGDAVVAVDLDPVPVAALRRGDLPVLEPSLPEVFAAARSRMTFSTEPADLAACPLVIVSRDVPTDDANASDPAPVLGLVDAALPHLRDGVTLVLMSQVPPGFTRRLAERIHARRPALGFRLYYWVETLIFGNAVERYLKPERIILGCARPADALPAPLEAAVRRFACPVLRMRYESAELAKTAINLYLCAAVTYANTLADLCEQVGADWSEMMPALRLDRRIGPAAYIKPGLGITGGNLERDLATLAAACRAAGVDGRFVETIIEGNARRLQWVHRRLGERLFPEVAHPVIALWGLAYKKNTRSTKNSPALRLLRELAGRAEFRAWDPVVRDAGDLPVKIVAERDEAPAGADCLLIMTDWDEFATLSRSVVASMRRPLVIDGVGVVDAARSDLGGAQYVAMGRPA